MVAVGLRGTTAWHRATTTEVRGGATYGSTSEKALSLQAVDVSLAMSWAF